MSAPVLRQALAALLRDGRDGRDATSSLTPGAERTIRRHVAMRWGAWAAAVAAVGIAGVVGTTAGISTLSADAPPPTPEAAAIPAVAHVPLDGGPQYENRWGELTCGDAAPTPNAAAPDQRLSIDLNRNGVGNLATVAVTWTAPENPAVGRSEPVVAVSAIELVAVRDAVVVGTIITEDAAAGWQQHGLTRTAGGHAVLDSDQFYCIILDATSDSYIYQERDLPPGAYEVFAVVRLFATPESVALFQALADTDFLAVDERARQRGIEYARGSRGCQSLASQWVTVRACLPDAIPTAILDEEAGTVRLLYDASALPQEFDVTLVSEPLEMVIE